MRRQLCATTSPTYNAIMQRSKPTAPLRRLPGCERDCLRKSSPKERSRRGIVFCCRRGFRVPPLLRTFGLEKRVLAASVAAAAKTARSACPILKTATLKNSLRREGRAAWHNREYGSATTSSAILGYSRRVERVDAMPAHVTGFGRRRARTLPRARGPAFESRQGRKARAVWHPAQRALWGLYERTPVKRATGDPPNFLFSLSL